MRKLGLATLLAAIAGLAAPAFAQPQPRPRIDVTRWVLAHGRWDDLRGKGIQTPDNPGGLVVPGVTPGVLPFGSAPPLGEPPRTVLDIIANSPRVTLDADGDGQPDGAANPLIVAGAFIPSGLTLAVAEGVDPASPDFMWEVPRPRFGGGNIYATVTIPGTEIVAGMELVTPEQMRAYRANSVIYEAPDVGLSPGVQDNALDGGTQNITAAASVGGARRTLARSSGYANPMEVNIIEVDQAGRAGRTQVMVRAVLDRLFEPAATDAFRWAVEANSGTLIADVVGTDVFTFTLPIEEPDEDGGPRFTQPDSLVKLSVVVSQLEPGGGNPFVNPIPPVPPRQSVGLYTFVSRMPTISDTEAIKVEPRWAERSICILLDASGSMADNNRMEQAKNSAMRVLSRLDDRTEVALIVYYDCGRIVVEHEFTTDHQKVLAILPRIQPSGGTPLADGTAFAKDYMRRHASGKQLDLIILTDGKETCDGDPVSAARQ